MTTETRTRHTPGPWATSRDAVPADHVQVTVYAESDGERVATAFRTEANAHLIAAAPALLAALEDALESLRRLPDAPDAYRITCINQAEDAIASARGE